MALTSTAAYERGVRVDGLRPRYGTANIRTWIGFKQFMGFAEEGVLGWFRARHLGPQTLYHDHGLALTIVDSSLQLPAVVEVDDVVAVDVERIAGGRFKVAGRVRRDGVEMTAFKGRVEVVLVREPLSADVAADLPPDLAQLVVGTVHNNVRRAPRGCCCGRRLSRALVVVGALPRLPLRRPRAARDVCARP